MKIPDDGGKLVVSIFYTIYLLGYTIRLIAGAFRDSRAINKMVEEQDLDEKSRQSLKK